MATKIAINLGLDREHTSPASSDRERVMFNATWSSVVQLQQLVSSCMSVPPAGVLTISCLPRLVQSSHSSYGRWSYRDLTLCTIRIMVFTLAALWLITLLCCLSMLSLMLHSSNYLYSRSILYIPHYIPCLKRKALINQKLMGNCQEPSFHGRMIEKPEFSFIVLKT